MSDEQGTAGTPVAERGALFWIIVVLLALTMVLLFTIPFVIPALIYLFVLRAQAKKSHRAGQAEAGRNRWAEAEIHRLGIMDHFQRQEELQNLKDEQSRLEQEIHQRRAEWEQEEREISRTKLSHTQEARAVERKLLNLKDMYDVQDYGLYDFENPADDSVELKETLKDAQGRIKEMVRNKTAATGTTTMTFDGDLKKGQKMVDDMVKLLLRSFNAEAENAVKTVRAGHLTQAKNRLEKSANAVERLGKSMSIRISPTFYELREKELKLTHQHLEAVKAAKEEEREIRARQREEAKAQKEFEALKAKQEKEVEHYRNVVASLQESGDEEQVVKMAATLAEAEEKLDDVENRMANTRAGYVYVASNRGAFGEGVVKIGMTRRLNPEERLKELSDASVPFNFDKHTIIFSEDAVALENALHKHFADRRVNLINMRREYFYATPAQVKDALIEHDVHVLEYHEEAEAVEFEASERQRTTRVQTDAGDI